MPGNPGASAPGGGNEQNKNAKIQKLEFKLQLDKSTLKQHLDTYNEFVTEESKLDSDVLIEAFKIFLSGDYLAAEMDKRKDEPLVDRRVTLKGLATTLLHPSVGAGAGIATNRAKERVQERVTGLAQQSNLNREVLKPGALGFVIGMYISILDTNKENDNAEIVARKAMAKDIVVTEKSAFIKLFEKMSTNPDSIFDLLKDIVKGQIELDKLKAN